MNDNAKKWVAALRSGKFTQGTGWLERNGKYCCLGVACRVYQEEVGDLRVDIKRDGIVFDKKYYEYCPLKVGKWLGLAKKDGKYQSSSLVEDNDNGLSFEEIANIIESEPIGLFIEETK